MMHRFTRRSLSGFTLIELLIVIAIIALLIGILLPAIGGARKSAKMVLCMNNLRGFSQAMANYASENKELLPNYSWKRGFPIPPDYKIAANVANKGYVANDMIGAAMQFTYIMQKRMNFSGLEYEMPKDWFPFVFYSHVPMMDYMSSQLPMPSAACPEDGWLKTIQKDYLNVESSGLPTPPTGGESGGWRYPFRLSYTMHPAYYSVDRQYRAKGEGGKEQVAALVYVENGFLQFSDNVGGPEAMPTGALGSRKIGDVRFPSQKTWGSDNFARHFGRNAQFFADPASRQPLAFFDASVRVYQTGETNPGWHPKNVSSRSNMTSRLSSFTTRVDYDPFISNLTTEKGERGYRSAAGWFQATRGGLRGWDVPRGTVRGAIRGDGTMTPVVENELDTTNVY